MMNYCPKSITEKKICNRSDKHGDLWEPTKHLRSNTWWLLNRPSCAQIEWLPRKDFLGGFTDIIRDRSSETPRIYRDLTSYGEHPENFDQPFTCLCDECAHKLSTSVRTKQLFITEECEKLYQIMCSHLSVITVY